VNAANYSITGTAEANALVRVYSDLNNNGLIDGSDALVGSQQLAGGATAYSISVPLPQDAANNFLVRATDVAGNNSSPADVPTITEDSTPPVITATRDGEAYAAAHGGWNNTNVIASYTASDANLFSPATGSDTFSSEGSGQTYTFTVTDLAGNSASATVNDVSIDKAAPTLSASINAPAAGGWYNIATGAATVTYVASDAGSGVSTPAAYAFGDGASQSLAAITVTDAAGNESSPAGAFSGINQDTTAPTTTSSLAGTAGTGGWYTSAVSVTLNQNDATSGVAQTLYSLDGGSTWQTYSSPFVVSAQGSSSVQFYSTDVAGNVQSTQTRTFKIDSIAPQVSGVYVRGSAWLSGFRNYLASHGMGDATLGYAIPAGSGAQLKALPWVNLNQISVLFSEDVSIDKADLALTGISVSAYDIADSTFSYSTATHVATWVLPSPVVLGRDKLLLSLNADGASAIADGAGLSLDGEWSNPLSTSSPSSSVFPSGNGTAGGDFTFRFNVLPGDVNQNSIVQATDVVIPRNLLNVSAASPSFNAYADVNGNGIIQATDAVVPQSNLNTILPAGNPPGAVFAASLLFSDDDLGLASDKPIF
jgi:hypothetical protein